ncbi:MAG: hypothetical protein GY951_13710 [Psychromonas sp.]|nr:hypothetical protein [Psychromonas sp.]
MNKTLKQLITATCLSAFITFSAQAALTEQDLTIYNQASAGNEDQVEPAYQLLSKLIEDEGATSITLVYLGSTETLKGRDAWMPWTAMKHVEKGLASIDKGLTLLSTEKKTVAQQSTLLGLKESYLTRAVAASTYSSLPDMFNHFERGYELFLTLLSEPEFNAHPFPATAWVYDYAIQAAIRAEDLSQASKWLTVMQVKDKNHPLTLKAEQAVAKEKS